jgi:hypothetical protein
LPSWLQNKMTRATKSHVEAEKFRKIWIEKLAEQARQSGKPRQGNAWEGFDAYRELEATDPEWLARPSTYSYSWPFFLLTNKLSREVRCYKPYATSVVADNQCFSDGIEALTAAETKLKNVRTQESTVKRQVDKTLRRCRLAVKKVRRSLEKERDSYWQDVLFAPPKERMKWSVYFDDQKQVRRIPPEELAEWEKIFNRARYPGKLVKQRDLDRRFQVRVALILRFYLPAAIGISLRTISRLTVLTYICGKLRNEGPDRLYLQPRVPTGGITVGSVDQKLRTAGIH